MLLWCDGKTLTMASLTSSGPADSQPLALQAAGLVRASHPRQALAMTTALSVMAAATGRAPREVALVALTTLVANVALGWSNDLVDAPADRRHLRIKPIPDGLPSSTVLFWLTCAVIVMIPLALTNGVQAGCFFLASIALAAAGIIRNKYVRQGPLSWLPWAGSFALLTGFITYGGWAGSATGGAPSLMFICLAALTGVGVHILSALWGLVAAEEDGWNYLPLWIARRAGANFMLIGVLIALTVTLAAMAVIGHQTGLTA